MLSEVILSAPVSTPDGSGPDTVPVPEPSQAPLVDEPSVDETFAGLTSAFADSISDIGSCSDVPTLGEPTTDDYIFQCVLGDGSEGIVFLVIGRRDRKPYAVKVVPKEVLPQGQFGNLFASRYAMEAMKGSPFIINLQAAFETTENFIFVFVSAASCSFCVGRWCRRLTSLPALLRQRRSQGGNARRGSVHRGRNSHTYRSARTYIPRHNVPFAY